MGCQVLIAWGAQIGASSSYEGAWSSRELSRSLACHNVGELLRRSPSPSQGLLEDSVAATGFLAPVPVLGAVERHLSFLVMVISISTWPLHSSRGAVDESRDHR